MPHVPTEKDRVVSMVIISVLLGVMVSIVSYVLLRAFFMRRKERENMKCVIEKSPVVITAATHTAPGGYPVSQIPPGAVYQTNMYAAPYPTAQQGLTVQMPMPANQATGAGMPPYPTAYTMPPAMTTGAPVGAANMNPPSYDMAVGGSSAAYGQPNNATPSYEKQAPYNPGYSQQ